MLQGLGAELNRIRRSRKQARAIQSYLSTHDVVALHVGAGTNVLEDWLNTDFQPKNDDIVFLDVAERLPFADNTLDFVYSEHLLAEISFADGCYHIGESFRALKPNGLMRIATPNLKFLIDIYLKTEHTDVQARFVRRTLDQAYPGGFYGGAFVLNHFVRGWDHQFIYDVPTLTEVMRRAGFAEIREWSVGQSDEPRLRNIEHHGDVISPEFNVLETMVLEGRKVAGNLYS